MADQAAPLLTSRQEVVQARLIHQSLQWPEADTVMAGAEVQQVGPLGEIRPTGQPAIEQVAALALAGLEQQRGQGEVVGQVCFPTGSQVGEVLLLWDVRLRHHSPPRGLGLLQQAQHFDDGVGLGPVNAAREGFLPDVSHGIQPQPADAVVEEALHQPGEMTQHLGLPPVQVHLVGAEGGPNLLAAAQGADQGRAAGANDLRPAGIGAGLEDAGASGFRVL